MKLKSKEVAAIRSHLDSILSLVVDVEWIDVLGITDEIYMILGILDKKDDKDNIENTESSN